jgi:hypothetical protein
MPAFAPVLKPGAGVGVGVLEDVDELDLEEDPVCETLDEVIVGVVLKGVAGVRLGISVECQRTWKAKYDDPDVEVVG